MVTGDTSSLLVWDLQTALRVRKTSPDKLSAVQLRELWAELENTDASFKKRDAAQNAILQMGVSAGGMIRQALKDSRSLEANRRLSALADKLKFSDGDRIRWLRCVELLERIGSPSARTTLESIRSFSDLETSTDATRSLERLAGF